MASRKRCNSFSARVIITKFRQDDHKYRKYPNLVHTQVEIIYDPNYLVRILFEEKVLELR